MIATSVKVQVEEDGGVHIPRDIVKQIGALPHQEIEVTLTVPETKPARVPVKPTQEERAKFDLALQLLKESMKGTNYTEAWKFIREGRRDRWF
jgi:antitoxin component of MazEF toxin-antitoxin module